MVLRLCCTFLDPSKQRRLKHLPALQLVHPAQESLGVGEVMGGHAVLLEGRGVPLRPVDDLLDVVGEEAATVGANRPLGILRSGGIKLLHFILPSIKAMSLKPGRK